MGALFLFLSLARALKALQRAANRKIR